MLFSACLATVWKHPSGPYPHGHVQQLADPTTWQVSIANTKAWYRSQQFGLSLRVQPLTWSYLSLCMLQGLINVCNACKTIKSWLQIQYCKALHKESCQPWWRVWTCNVNARLPSSIQIKFTSKITLALSDWNECKINCYYWETWPRCTKCLLIKTKCSWAR